MLHVYFRFLKTDILKLIFLYNRKYLPTMGFEPRYKFLN